MLLRLLTPMKPHHHGLGNRTNVPKCQAFMLYEVPVGPDNSICLFGIINSFKAHCRRLTEVT